MRLEVSQEQVGRNFEEDVGDEEDGQGDVGLVRFRVEMQLFG